MASTISMFIKLALIVFNIHQYNADKCNSIRIGKEFYKRTLLATMDGYPTGIVIDPKTENIFFILNKKNYTKGIHILKHGSLGIKPIPIGDDFIGRCVAIDAANHIYVGTNQGILQYDYSKSVIAAERPIGDDDVRNIFIDKSDQMYITTGPTYEVFRFLNGSAAVKRFDMIPKAYSFVMDRKGNVFYEYVDGRLYFYAKEYFEPVQYKGFTRQLKYILKMNNNDEAIVAVKGALFKLTINSMLPEKIGDLHLKITGLAFDERNNIIVGTKEKIYKYKPLDSNEPCPLEDYFMTAI